MSWSEIHEHGKVLDGFRRALSRDRLASTFLFVGPGGIGKRTFALKLAQSLLCETNAQSQLEPCGDCPGCLQVAAQTHPDLELVSKPRDKSFIPLESFIGDKDHRNREGLCHRISLKPMRGRRKIAIIDDADHLNIEGANCLLKTLEEPPPRSLIILIGTSEQRQLPTIRSRCQIVRFASLSTKTVEKLLVEKGLLDQPEDAPELATLSEGSLQQALELNDPQLREFRAALFRALNEQPLNGIALAAEIQQFVDAAGKDAPSRRYRLRQIAGWATEHYRRELRNPTDPETAAQGLDRSLTAINQVNANANLTSVIDAWTDDLARLSLAQLRT